MSEFSDEALQSYPFADITSPLNGCLVALEEISSDVSPGFASGKHNSDGTGVPHLRPMNVDRDGQIDLNVIKSVADSNGIELRLGDVLFNNTNSAELVGKTAAVSGRETGFAFSNHMTRIRPESGVNSVFAARQFPVDDGVHEASLHQPRESGKYFFEDAGKDDTFPFATIRRTNPHRRKVSVRRWTVLRCSSGRVVRRVVRRRAASSCGAAGCRCPSAWWWATGSGRLSGTPPG